MYHDMPGDRLKHKEQKKAKKIPNTHTQKKTNKTVRVIETKFPFFDNDSGNVATATIATSRMGGRSVGWLDYNVDYERNGIFYDVYTTKPFQSVR